MSHGRPTTLSRMAGKLAGVLPTLPKGMTLRRRQRAWEMPSPRKLSVLRLKGQVGIMWVGYAVLHCGSEMECQDFTALPALMRAGWVHTQICRTEFVQREQCPFVA